MQTNPYQRHFAIVRLGVTFTAANGQAFFRLPIHSSGGFSIFPVRSPEFRHWFFREFYARHDSLPTPREFNAVLHLLEAEANHNDHDNCGLSVWRRVGCRGPGSNPTGILLDLANPARQFVDIYPTGWKTTAGPGVLLQTSRSALSIPEPVATPADAPAPLDTLRSCLNLPTRTAWLRCLAWLLAAFRPAGPYPVLILQGPPVSTLSPQLADALCRLSSGLGATFRETAAPEPLFQSYKRPVLLTVTERWSCPAGLAERALVVTLPPLPPESRRSEAAFLETLHPAWPAILGSLCTAISTALSRMPTMNPQTGCHADALAWAVAASPALSTGGGNLCTEEEMQRAFDPPPAIHPIVAAVRNLFEQRRGFHGTAAELWDLLRPLLDPRAGPQSPQSVSHHLKKCVLTLADSGIELKFRRLHGGNRIIDLSTDPGDDDFPQNDESSSPDSATPPQPTETEEVPAA
ncbi:hypothetical protein SBA4_3510001 [Candidatus Sulfopaludibacter sp. SbA4]|nr:hypothetical protein SBA4_3510001 [Candidatus Sulfopaludibacter sp. SbA4]